MSTRMYMHTRALAQYTFIHAQSTHMCKSMYMETHMHARAFNHAYCQGVAAL